MIGTILKKTPKSGFQPSEEVRDLTASIQQDYQVGYDILVEPWEEFNFRSVLDDVSKGQKMFNAFVDTEEEDPNEAWKWRGTRSMARNKAISMHAQLTANYLLPMFVAQNEDDDVDKDYSEVMREIVEWLAQPTNSNYQQSFIQVALSMMSNPVTYMGAEFFRVMQTVKEETKNGDIITKEVVDEVLSGFQANIYSASQILINNVYERNIQRQKCIIEVVYRDYSEMEAKYGDHENWGHVEMGKRAVYNTTDQLFYDVIDDDHPSLVVEEIYKNRRDDVEVPFVGGIYMGESNVKANRIKHRDHRNRPKYNKIPFGYMRIGDHFFYYKSMMNALQWDNMAYDAMSEIVYNQAILQLEMPVAISGTDKIDSSVVFPGAVIALEDANSKVMPLMPRTDTSAGFNTLREVEKSMDEGSVNKTTEGQLPQASQKAFNVAQAQANARKNIGIIGKSLGQSMVQYGDLMKDIIINDITVPQVEELMGGNMKMKYKTFILENKEAGGKVGDRKIKFDEGLIGTKMTDQEKLEKNLELLENTDWPKKMTELKLVNPVLFRKHNYLTKIDIEEMFTKNNQFMQPVLMQLKAVLAQDPYVDQEQLTRKLLYSFFQSEGEDFMKEGNQEIPGLPNMAPEAQNAPQAQQKVAQPVAQPSGVDRNALL